MKRLIKWMLILSVIFCLLGIGVITAGAMMDGGYYLGHALKAADRWDGHWEEGYRALEQVPFLKPGNMDLPAKEVSLYEDIRELEADVAGMVIFEESDELAEGQLRVIKGNDGEDYEYRQEGDTLKIGYPKKRRRGNMNIRNTVTLQVPVNSCLKEIDIEVSAGEFLATAMQADEISLQVKAGRIEVGQGKAGILELESDAGQIVCQADVSRKVSAESDLGDILLSLKGEKEDFDYELECSAGIIALGGSEPEEYQGLHHTSEIDNGAGKKAELECSAGSISVDYYDGQ